MKPIVGVKYTHDAAVALIKDNRLEFSIEVEKINNNPRYSDMLGRDLTHDIVNGFDYDLKDCNVIVDGWRYGKIIMQDTGIIHVAPYHEHDDPYCDDLLKPSYGDSYRHAAGHVVGSYVTSPFSANREKAYVLTWDGGQSVRLHHFDPSANKKIEFKGSLFELRGTLYGIMGSYFGPYRNDDVIAGLLSTDEQFGGRDRPGKLMSYVSYGQPNMDLLQFLSDCYPEQEMIYKNQPDYLKVRKNAAFEHKVMAAVLWYCWNKRISDEDALATIHCWLELILVNVVKQHVPEESNLIFTGGSALNIKWNSALRRAGYNVWVPPFPNDTGSALGTAACHYVNTTKEVKLDWDVYCGPNIIKNPPETGKWRQTKFDAKELANFFVLCPMTPVVVLNGRSEIGPRALGHRSIMMSVRFYENKVLLNRVKQREHFRPVSPICLEEEAPNYFSPGCADPYMLFNHDTLDSKKSIIPAVVHIDGTARLQTVGPNGSKFVRELLEHYYRLSGIPMLCNTSANLNGSGFFPDVASAMRWCEGNEVCCVWCEGDFYEKL